MQYCPDCGVELLKPDEKFCTECGASLSEKKSPKPKAAAKREPAKPLIAPIKMPDWGKMTAKASSAVPKKQFGAREMAIGAAVVLLVAVLVNAGVSAGLSGLQKGMYSKLQAQMDDNLQKYKEDLARSQIDADSAKVAQLTGELQQFTQTFSYEGMHMAATAQEYNASEKVSDRNLARKAAAAKKLALQANEFISQIEGFKAFATDNLADIERISGNKYNMSESAFSEFDTMETQMRQMELQMAGELEAFAGTSSSRMAIAADAINTLKEAAGSS